jgi:hypothetical protein
MIKENVVRIIGVVVFLATIVVTVAAVMHEFLGI